MKKCSITVNDYTFSFPVGSNLTPKALQTRVHTTMDTIIDQFNLDLKTAECSYKIEEM